MSKETNKELGNSIAKLLDLEIERGQCSITKIGDAIHEEIKEFQKDTPCDINNGYIMGLKYALDIVSDTLIDYTIRSIEILLDCKEIFKND